MPHSNQINVFQEVLGFKVIVINLKSNISTLCKLTLCNIFEKVSNKDILHGKYCLHNYIILSG